MWPVTETKSIIVIFPFNFVMRGAWVAQSVVSDFGLGHDLTVCEFEPHVGLCADSLEPGAYFRFCVSLSLTLPRSCSVFLGLRNK